MDMPFENFCYYINLLREIRGDEPIDFLCRGAARVQGRTEDVLRRARERVPRSCLSRRQGPVR